MKRKILSIAPIFLLLSGCSFFSPEYQKPEIDNPQQWQHMNSTTTDNQIQIEQLAWWEQFNDPMLNDLIEQALENNNQLQVALGKIAEAQATIAKVNATWLPTVGLGGGGFVGQGFSPHFSNETNNPIFDNINPSGSQTFDGYAAGFVPSYTLNIMAQLKAKDAAELNLAMQKSIADATRLAIISQVAGSYLSLMGMIQQRHILETEIQAAQALRVLAQQQYENGSSSELTVLGVDQMIANLKANLPSIAHNITQLQNALQVLTNNNPNAITPDRSFDDIDMNNAIPVGIPSQVLQSRPDVAIAEYQLKLANANIALARSRYFPTINLTGMLGAASANLSNLFSLGSNFWATQLAAGIPIFDGTIGADTDKAKAQYYQAYYHYIDTVRSAFANVDNALSHNTTLRATTEQYQLALTQAQQQLKIGETQLDLGAISPAEIIGMQINQINMQSKLNEAKIKQVNSIVEVYQALGGGYAVNKNSEDKLKKFNNQYDI